jgi:hypothetical protein
MITNVILSTLFTFALSKYAIPLYGILSGIVSGIGTYLLKSKLTKKKIVRDDFQVIKDALYEEIDRLKDNAKDLQYQVHEARAENEKCEARFFELSTQHKELLKHCIFLTKEIKVLKERMLFQEETNKVINVQTRNDPEDSGDTKQ